MTEPVDTIFSNPLTGETVRKLPEIEPDIVSGADGLPDDVKNTEIPPELQENLGVEPVEEDQ